MNRAWLGLVCLALLGGCAGPPSPRTETSTPAPPPVERTAPATAGAAIGPSPAPQTPTPRAPTPTPTNAATAAPPTAAGTPAPALRGDLIARTAHLDIYRVAGGLSVTIALQLAPQFETAIGRVGARMDADLNGRVAISFEPPQGGACAVRGLTLSHEREIHLYYAPQTAGERILPIVAHELAHELQHDKYGWEAHRRSDTILLEGQATWASGDYARGADGRPTWASGAIQALAEGRLLPLSADLERDCRTTTRNTAYTGWASFVDFLISTYGRDRFDELYRSGRERAPGSADYSRVYSKNLDQLDQEWRTYLRGQGPLKR